MLEGRGAGVKGLRQTCLLDVLVLLEALSYARCRSHGVHQRRLIQPGNSVWGLSLSQIHQRCPGSPALTLNVPLDDVTAWRNSWYCGAETFFWDPSSSSSSELALSLTLSSVFRAAEKSTGEASLVQDSEEEDLDNARSWTSGISGLVHPSGTPDWSPGSSVWSPGMPDWSPGSSRWSLILSGRRCLVNGPGLEVWSCHTRVHPSLHESPHWHKVN